MNCKTALIAIFTGVGLMTVSADNSATTGGVRRPAVAGTFYESNPSLLREILLRYLSEGEMLQEPVRFLVCPHAGYLFSGPVAGKGYATLDPEVKRVILLGPSHYKAFTGMAVPRFEKYATPLGTVPVDREVVDKLKKNSGVIEADGFDEPEHCLEVQVPFLQVRLHDFSLVPILCGHLDPAASAAQLLPFIDEKTAVVVSSDLSHYQPQNTARKIDDTTIETILSGKTDGGIDACGETPIRIMMHLAAKLKREAVVLDVRTSYDTAPVECPKSRVVGYASIAFLTPKAAARFREKGAEAGNGTGTDEFSPALRKELLVLARGSLEASVQGAQFNPSEDMPQSLREYRGCFVTLTKGGALRGCIGYIEPIKPLFQAVIENAKNAALSDPRFPAVTPDELRGIEVEISVLTKPEKLVYRDADDLLAKLVPGRDGVILSDGRHQSTFLPQVWEQLPDKVKFLEHLSLKGGMARDGWKKAEVKTYRAVHFSE